ncbi:MAG: hypothetical protein AAFR59_07975, partial [Bacteroidota bacterium]
IALGYAILWGLMTAVARTWAYGDFSGVGAEETFREILPQTVFRLAHGLLPLWILYTMWNKKEGKEAIEQKPAVKPSA